MAQQAKYTKEGFLQEIPENDDLMPWDDNYQECRFLHAPDFKGEVGKIYTEGMDYELETVWDKTDPHSFTNVIAIPIQSASQDDKLDKAKVIDWFTVINICTNERLISSEKVNELHSKFTITKKQ